MRTFVLSRWLMPFAFLIINFVSAPNLYAEEAIEEIVVTGTYIKGRYTDCY